MKTQSSPWKLPVFIGALLILALFINVFFYSQARARHDAEAREQRQAEAAARVKQASEKSAERKQAAADAKLEAAKALEAQRVRNEAEAKSQAEAATKKAIEDASAEHNRILAKYLTPGFIGRPGSAHIAVAIESDQGAVDAAIANAFARRSGSSSIQIMDSFFKPEFVADKFVDNIMSGDTSIFDRLELTNSLSAVLVGRETVTYSTNAALENTISAKLNLECAMLPLVATRSSQSWSFTTSGVGFNSTDALKQAEERLIDKISNDSTVSLGDLSENK